MTRFIRKASWKKSLSAHTKGQATRSIKRALIPGYGKRGVGWAHPRRKLYNKLYNRSTISIRDLMGSGKKRRSASVNSNNGFHLGCFGTIVLAILIVIALQYWYLVLAVAIVAGIIWYFAAKQKRENKEKEANEELAEEEKEKERSDSADAVYQLKQYKNLLDDGAITQTEYAAKKKELLHISDDISNDEHVGDDWQNF